MKIVFDHSAFNQSYGGVPKYFVEVIRRMLNSGVDVEVLIRCSSNKYVGEIKDNVIDFLPDYTFKGKPKLERIVGDVYLLRMLLNKRDIDVFHATHYSTYAKYLLNKKAKFVSTIHDMNQWAIPEYYPKFSLRKKRQEFQMNKADRIIAVSEKTKSDIVNYFPHLESKVEVIHHGVSVLDSSDVSEMIGIPEKYLLYVGARNPYKNFARLVRVFSRLSKEDVDLHLVCVGGGFSESEKALFAQRNIPLDRVKSIPASDAELHFLYKHALAFVFPSLYEGFGLPCLEAMVNGCPVVVSDNSVFPEVCGKAGIYFDPFDEISMYNAISSALYDSAQREFVMGLMPERLSMFSWDKSAEKHIQLYRELGTEND